MNAALPITRRRAHVLRSRSAFSDGAARRGFTLVEASIALALTAVAGTALLLSVTNSTDETDEAMKTLIAEGMAQQLLDEVSGMRYMENGASAYDTFLGPGTPEQAVAARSLYDDIDDYNGSTSQPPVDRWGVTRGSDSTGGATRHPAFQLGSGYFSRWRQTVSVFYVRDTSPTTPVGGSTTTDYRAVQVRITFDDPVQGTRELANALRVVSYVPMP